MPKPADYIDVAERIQVFYGTYPDGRLTTGSPPQLVEAGGRLYVWFHARAYRTPDDPLPGDGWASEPVPGPTPFTKDSELQNAETSAWGRAIVALGFETKHIASANEVRNRQAADGRPSSPAAPPPPLPDALAPAADDDPERARLVGELLTLAHKAGTFEPALAAIEKHKATHTLEEQKAWLAEQLEKAQKVVA